MSAEEIRVGQVESTRVQVKEISVPKGTLGDEVYAITNFYIKQSRQYFPNKKLRTYIVCPCFSLLACLICFGSVFGFIAIVGVAPKELPLGFLIACAVFLLIYCQHEWVNQNTLPVVWKQPVLDHLRHATRYEVYVTELKGVALKNYQAGIGFVKLTQGKIMFQAFSKAVAKKMSQAKCQSRMMLCFFLLMSALNIFFVVKAYSKY